MAEVDTRPKVYRPAVAGILGAILFILTAVVASAAGGDHSHLHQFISETYATGTPYGFWLRWMGFIPAGVLMAYFLFSAAATVAADRTAAIALGAAAVFYGLGTVVAGIFPCDAGCPSDLTDQSTAQLIHNLSGYLTYLIVPIAMIITGFQARNWSMGRRISTPSILLGIVAFIFVAMLSSDPFAAYKGLWQRIVEGSILLWVIAVARIRMFGPFAGPDTLSENLNPRDQE